MNYASKLENNSSMVQPRFCLACYHACSGSCSGNCKGSCNTNCGSFCIDKCSGTSYKK